MKPIRLMTGFFTVGVWTLLSRILGFVREVMLLGLIGPGPVMDAFVAAFRLPNMFRRFFSEGAFNAAFVPMFSKRLEAETDAAQFAQNAFSGLFFIVTLLTALGMIFMLHWSGPQLRGSLKMAVFSQCASTRTIKRRPVGVIWSCETCLRGPTWWLVM